MITPNSFGKYVIFLQMRYRSAYKSVNSAGAAISLYKVPLLVIKAKVRERNIAYTGSLGA